MMALMGFAVGYMVGAEQGREGMDRLIASWKHIRGSDEFAAAIDTAKMMAVSFLKQAFETGTGVVSGEVKGVVNRRLRAA